MGNNISFPSNTKEVIDAIRQAIGRGITFALPYQSRCPNCNLDPVTNTSTNSFCTTCSGTAYITTFSGIVISGHITHKPSDIQRWSPGGTYVEGDCLAQIEYSPYNITVVESASYMVVDGKKYTLKDKALRGVPQVNRIILELKERN